MFGFYYRALCVLQDIVFTVGADGGRACTDNHAYWGSVVSADFT